MKINCDLPNNYFRCFNEARGIVLRKNKLLKKPTSVTFTYLTNMLFVIILGIILIILSILINGFNGMVLYYFIILMLLTYIIGNILYFINILVFRKRQNFKNYIVVDNDGITDKSYYGIKMTFSWDKVKLIIIKKYSIVILTDTPVYFYFGISKKNQLLKEIKKYKKNIIVVEKGKIN